MKNIALSKICLMLICVIATDFLFAQDAPPPVAPAYEAPAKTKKKKRGTEPMKVDDYPAFSDGTPPVGDEATTPLSETPAKEPKKEITDADYKKPFDLLLLYLFLGDYIDSNRAEIKREGESIFYKTEERFPGAIENYIEVKQGKGELKYVFYSGNDYTTAMNKYRELDEICRRIKENDLTVTESKYCEGCYGLRFSAVQGVRYLLQVINKPAGGWDVMIIHAMGLNKYYLKEVAKPVAVAQVLERIETYTAPSFPGSSFSNKETYDNRVLNNVPVPPTLTDVLITDVSQLINNDLHLSQTNESAVEAALNIYMTREWRAIAGYRTWTHLHFIRSLTLQERKQLTTEVVAYLAKYGVKEMIKKVSTANSISSSSTPPADICQSLEFLYKSAAKSYDDIRVGDNMVTQDSWPASYMPKGAAEATLSRGTLSRKFYYTAIMHKNTSYETALAFYKKLVDDLKECSFMLFLCKTPVTFSETPGPSYLKNTDTSMASYLETIADYGFWKRFDIKVMFSKWQYEKDPDLWQVRLEISNNYTGK